jgi:uroporphyrinogen decarboxylase
MRQAGRYLPEYCELREGISFLDFCKSPQLCTQATLLPIDLLGVDAAILFADLLPILEGMGAQLDYPSGVGPVIANPVREASDIAHLQVPDPHTASGYVLEAIQLIQRALARRVPLIGFAGAPFTLASYLIEGQGSRDHRQTKRMLYREPALFDALLDKLAATVAAYLAAQIDAGVDAVMLFDSWAGVLAPAEFARFAGRYARKTIEALGARVPSILYVNGAGTLLEEMRTVGCDVLGLDWRIDIDEVRQRLGWDVALQGNLDPCLLYADPTTIINHVQRLMLAHGDRPGHIVNLGSGILPDIPVDHARALVEAVKAHRWPL